MKYCINQKGYVRHAKSKNQLVQNIVEFAIYVYQSLIIIVYELNNVLVREIINTFYYIYFLMQFCVDTVF